MRNLVFAINISLDGCIDHTRFSPDTETMTYFTQLIQDADTFVYGRITWQLMVPYWNEAAKNPSGDKATDDFARAFDSIGKTIVISRTLDNTEAKNTSIVHTNLKEEILKLKQQPGKNISTGGVTIPAQLMELGLIDEYHFVVHPIIVGEGRRLFDGANLPENLQLKLVESKNFKSGCVAYRYLRR